ncbi:MAG: hypothetical protein WBW37_05495, partial [Methyloceanibacter sp.]
MTFSSATTSAEREPPDGSPRQHEEELGLIPFADDHLSFVEHQLAHDGLQQMALIGAQPVEYIELGQSKFRFRILARHFRKQLDGIAFDHAGVQHHIGDGPIAIAVASGLLRLQHRLVDFEPAAG